MKLRVTNRRLAMFGALTVSMAVVSSLASAVTAAGQGPDSLVTFHQGPVPVQDLSVISAKNRDLLYLATKMVDDNKADFAGVTVDKTSTVIVSASSERGAELASGLFVGNPVGRVARVPNSVRTVGDLGSALLESDAPLMAKVATWRIDPTTGYLVIGAFEPLTTEDETVIQDFATKNAVHIDVFTDTTSGQPTLDSRLDDTSPFSGGFRYATTNGSTSSSQVYASCTGGFGYVSGTTTYVLTAGHCFPRGTTYDYMWSTTAAGQFTKGQWGGRRNNSTFLDGTGTVAGGNDNDFHGDLSLVNVDVAGAGALGNMWWGSAGTTTKLPVTSARTATVGDPVCINGAVSGSDCGLTVQATNVNFNAGGGEVVRNADFSTSGSPADCSQPGDSGGGLVYDHLGTETQGTAEGIISGHFSGPGYCDQYTTGIEEAQQSWGGHVKYAQ